MKRLLILFIVTGLFACNDQPAATTTDTVTDSVVTAPIDMPMERKMLDSALQQMQTPSQFFKAPLHHPVTFTCAKGMQVDVNGDDLVTVSGGPMGNHIDVEVKELTNVGELARNKATTMTGDKLLESGGAYYINMTTGGEQLKLKQGKVLRVRLKPLTADKMSIFYGKRDTSGFVNWSLPPIASQSTMQSEKESAAIDEYGEDAGPALSKEAMRDLSTAQMAVEMGELGWINCDRFLQKQVALTSVTFAQKIADSVQVYNAFLVFRDINSVMPGFGCGVGSAAFSNVPEGYKVEYVAVGFHNGRFYSYKTPLAVSRNLHVDVVFKESTLEEIKALFN